MGEGEYGAPRHAAYSSSEMPAIPTTDACRSASTADVAAPMPAPPTSGHCRVHARTPAARLDRARASRNAFAAA